MVNQIFNRDCIEVMKDMSSEFIDLVVTDPPYLINYSSFRTNSKIIKNDNNNNWVAPFFRELSRVVKMGSHLYEIFLNPFSQHHLNFQKLYLKYNQDYKKRSVF